MGRLPFVRHLMSMNFEGILRLRCGQQEAVLFRCVLSELAIGAVLSHYPDGLGQGRRSTCCVKRLVSCSLSNLL